MSGDDIVIGGIGLAPIITFLVQLLKKAGLPDGSAGFAAAVLSVLGYIILQVTKVFPEAEPGIVGVLKVLAFIAATFGASILAYVSAKKAELPLFKPKAKG